MSFASDERENKLIRLQLTQAVEKFMVIPERIEEELAPSIKKLERLSQSPIVIRIKTGGLVKIQLDDLKKEVSDFIKYLDGIPQRYLVRVDSHLDFLRNEDLDKEELSQRYVSAISNVKRQLIQVIREKYAIAIRAIVEYRENMEQDGAVADEQEKWVAPRNRHTGPVYLSILPPQILDQLPFGRNRETLDELSLEEIQDVAHTLAVDVSMGGRNN